MYTRKLKGGKPVNAVRRVPFAPIPQTSNAWKLQQMRVNKSRRNNSKKTAKNANNNYGEVWPVNTSKWQIPVGNINAPDNVYTAFNKPTMTNTERKKYHSAWNAYFNTNK